MRISQIHKRAVFMVSQQEWVKRLAERRGQDPLELAEHHLKHCGYYMYCQALIDAEADLLDDKEWEQ